jgi:hypothetical protein
VALIPILIFGVFGLVALAALAFWIWMLVDCATKGSGQGNDKLIWILDIVFTQRIGALIYFFVRRPERKKLFGV